jgi:hypothetical protein
MLLGQIMYLIHLGQGNIPSINTRRPFPVAMHMEHDPGGFFMTLMKNQL